MAAVEQKIANAPLGSFPVHSDSLDANGGRVQYVKLDMGAAGLSSPVTALNPLPVTVSGAASGDGAILDGVTSSIRGTVFDLASSNPQSVAIVDGTGAQITSFGGGTQYTEDVAAPADPVGTNLNMVRADSLGALTTTDGDNLSARGTNKGELYVKHVDTIPVTQSGTWNIGTVTAVTAISNALPAGANAIGKLAANSGVTIGAVEITAAQTLSTVTTVGAVTAITNALPAGTNAIGKLSANSGVDIGDVDVTSAVITGGGIADDATTPGNPVMVGGFAKETDNTDPGSVSAEDDVTRCITDRNRRLLVNNRHPNGFAANDNQSSAQTNTVLQAAPGANLSLYITDIIISNGATAGDVRFVEDPAGSPVIKIPKIYVAITSGAVKNFVTPIRITANKAFGYTSTTVTTHSVLVCGYIAP